MSKWIRRIIILLLVLAVSYQFVCIGKISRDFKDFFNIVFETIEPKPDFTKYKNATVEIKVGKKGGAGVICKIDEKYLYILTADHIIKQSGNVSIQINTKKEKIKIENLDRKYIYRDKNVDLALITLLKPKGEFDYLPITNRPVEQGDRIFTIGHPLNFHYTATEGIVSNESAIRKHNNQDVTYLMISSPSFSGNSGGAVVNSRGELIGIVVGIMYVEQPCGWDKQTIFLFHMTFAVKIENINKLLEELK